MNKTINYEDKLNTFIAGIGEGSRVVLLTSGGTSVKLEKNTVRSIENFSTGKRGALCAEEFLSLGYYVIFLHREGSCVPFCHNISIHSLFESTGSQFDEEFLKNKTLYQTYIKEKLCLLTFVTIEDYLQLLPFLCQKINQFGSRSVIFLAAAVSDYYIPEDLVETHKIQSTSDNLLIQLYPVKKDIYKIKEEWNPNAFVINFKLETDEDILIHKAINSLKKAKSDYVIANILQTRYDKVLILNLEEKYEIHRDEAKHIETKLTKQIINLHDKYIAERG